jgi:hypothetical protein
MDPATAVATALFAGLSVLALGRALVRSRRRRKVNMGEVSHQWLTEHVNDVRE